MVFHEKAHNMNSPTSTTKDLQGPYDGHFFDGIEEGSIRSARVVLPIVFDLVAPRSVIDVGCGRGAWLSVAMELGIADVRGWDGDYVQRDNLLIPRDRFEVADLSRPLKITGTYDLALCLEVAEHLPKRISRALVESLTSVAPVVLFSAAIPGQGGNHHINEQFPEFWWRLFDERGYVALDVVRPRIAWDARAEPWYAQNMLLYVDRKRYECNPALQGFAPATDSEQLLPWVCAATWRNRVTWKGPLGLLKLLVKRL